MQAQDSHYKQRTAFVLNANAKNVTDRLVKRLMPIIPAGDLYFSRGLSQATEQFSWILNKGYGQVFSGGGDGTVMATINMLNSIAAKYQLQLPKIGILKLGTGNALASVLGAQKAARDARYIVNGGRISETKIGMVECENGAVAPFAGVGLDAVLVNDYIALKQKFEHTQFKPFMCSVLGYIGAAVTKSIPQQLMRSARPRIKVTSTQPAYKIVSHNGSDLKITIPAGSVLFEGPASIMSVGSIRVFGFNFAMFPFMGSDPTLIQLRVSSCPLSTLLANIHLIWRGSFRHPDLHDFLLRDAIIESDSPMPYQVGGDACGYRSRVIFKASSRPIEMVQLQRSLPKNGEAHAAPSRDFAQVFHAFNRT